jgi:hypothetical protein
MGATTMRLGKVSGPEGASKVKGVNKRLMGLVVVGGLVVGVAVQFGKR